MAVLVVLATLTGCGNVLYAYRISAASAKLEEAKTAGADRTAAYEFTLAEEHLRKARSEASEADYGDAYELSGLADEYAQQALDKANRRASPPAPSPSSRPSPTAQPEATTAPEQRRGRLEFSTGGKP